MTRYRPSNGAEGLDFQEAFCFRCKRDAAFRAGEGESCPIVAATMIFDVDDPGYPPEWIDGPDGPCCTAYEPEG